MKLKQKNNKLLNCQPQILYVFVIHNLHKSINVIMKNTKSCRHPDVDHSFICTI